LQDAILPPFAKKLVKCRYEKIVSVKENAYHNNYCNEK
jgi:hypothetical protein